MLILELDLKKELEDNFGKAFKKAFLVTWAEFATERMGEMIPMFGKYIRRDLMGNPEWLKRATLGYFLHKRGSFRVYKLKVTS